MKPKTLKHLGNILILGSLLSASIVFGPILRDYILFNLGFDTYHPSQSSVSFSIDIPSVRISAPVAANINPWNKSEYQLALRQGIAHARGSALPGESGTTYLFAHSSDNPLAITRYNTSFYRLHRLKLGAIIHLTYQGRNFTYRVVDKITVNPSQIEFLTQLTDDQLILQTCTPIGTDWRRLLVIAKPISAKLISP